MNARTIEAYKKYREEYGVSFGKDGPHMHYEYCPKRGNDNSDEAGDDFGEHGEDESICDSSRKVVHIIDRGCLAIRPTSMCLVSKMASREAWSLYIGEKVKFRADIFEFNFRPLFRLCRMLKMILKKDVITARKLHIHFRFPEKTNRKGLGRHQSWWTDRTYGFKDLQEAFARHWLLSFLLWSARDDEAGSAADDAAPNEDTFSSGNKSILEY